MATAMLALATDGAAAQRFLRDGPGAAYPAPGRPAPRARPTATPVPPANRWGSKIGGRWWAGANAPGGWNAYRRPHRGWALPPYWIAPRFVIADFNGYNLASPPPGYRWSRYYDDAVLIDARGSVFDSVDGIDWDGPGYGERYARRDDGPPYAIDRREDRRGPPPPPPPPGARYGEPVYDAGPDYPPPPPPNRWVSPDGTTTVTTTVGGQPGGYAYGGNPGGVTTVTVQTAPVVTTTTTEYYEDRVTYSRPAKRKAWRRPGKYIKGAH